MTGDGVNVSLALKKAHVGTTVEGKQKQHRAAIVLTNQGLSVVVEAIGLTKKIFRRMNNYVIYRIASTLQLLVFLCLATLCVDPEMFIAEIGSHLKLSVGKMSVSLPDAEES